MVEGKVEETFGPTLEEWLRDASSGKEERLRFLQNTLTLSGMLDGTIRYQLLHRVASAALEAERFHAAASLMIVHSFSVRRSGFSDFEAFARLFGVTIRAGVLSRLCMYAGIPVYAGWVEGDRRFVSA